MDDSFRTQKSSGVMTNENNPETEFACFVYHQVIPKHFRVATPHFSKPNKKSFQWVCHHCLDTNRRAGMRSVHRGDSTREVFSNKMNEDSEQFSIFLINLVIVFLLHCTQICISRSPYRTPVLFIMLPNDSTRFLGCIIDRPLTVIEYPTRLTILAMVNESWLMGNSYWFSYHLSNG